MFGTICIISLDSQRKNPKRSKPLADLSSKQYHVDAVASWRSMMGYGTTSCTVGATPHEWRDFMSDETKNGELSEDELDNVTGGARRQVA